MLHQQMGDTQKQLSQPFTQEEAMREKTKRLEELTAELDMDSSTKTNSAEEIIKTGYQKHPLAIHVLFLINAVRA